MSAIAPMPVPVIAIDGPTASGKGTVAQRVAAALGYHYLDSGALYRLVALQSLRSKVAVDDAPALAAIAAALRPSFAAGVTVDGEDLSDEIRREEVGVAASKIARHPAVRAALLDLQRGFRRAPGLVADGRDMGTVVFPDARTKVFLTANVEARAQRRLKQLSEKGISANLAALLLDLNERDARDAERATAPLRPAEDAKLLDSSALTIDEVVAQVIGWHRGGA